MVAAYGYSQNSGPEFQKKIYPILQNQVGMDDASPDEKNPSGLSFRFSKIDEATISGAHFIRYRAYVAGADQKKRYSLALLKIGASPQIVADEVYVNSRGLLMVHKPRADQLDKDEVEDADEIDLAVQAARGEPVRFILAAADRATLIPGMVVPYPIESVDGNCRLEARLGLPNGEAILISADGLLPNSEVPVHMVSGGDTEDGRFSVNAQGHAVTIDLPYADGKESGTLQVNVAIKGCVTSVEIPWGKGSYHPL